MKNQQKTNRNTNSSNNKIVYLTFDDGPSENTEKILDILLEYDIKGTFFVNGNHTEFGRRIYKRIVNEGHAIGNHTYSHSYQTIYSSVENYLADTLRLEKLIYETTGIKPSIIRFPGGSNNLVSRRYSEKALMKELATTLTEMGYQYFDWNIDSKDSSSTTPPKENIIKAVLSVIGDKRGAIILFHDSLHKTTTVEALGPIIETLRYMGYEFQPLSEDAFCVQFQ